MTVPAAIKELEKIEMLKGADNEYRLDYAVTARQKEILKAFGLTASNVQKQAAAISSDLARIEVEEFVKDEQAELEAMLENMPQQQDQGEDSGMWSDGADYDELFDEVMASQQGQTSNVQVDDEMDMS